MSEVRLTWDSTASSTSSQMINNGGIALDYAVYRQVGAVSSVGDFFVLKNSQGCFDRIGCGGTILQELHANIGGAVSVRNRYCSIGTVLS